jgi:hypothetical protein
MYLWNTFSLPNMIKSLIAIGAAATAVALAPVSALAGPYLNIESNAGFAGGDGVDMDYIGSTTDFHIGVEGAGEDTSWYLQAGPALVQPDNGEADVEFSGKIGGAVAITADKNLNLYGEVSFITVDDFDAANVGTKIGVKYLF